MKRFNHFPVTILQKTLLFISLFLCITQLSVFSSINLSNSADDSLWPALAVNSRGEIMVVWLEWSGDNYYRIFRDGQWSSVKNCGIANQRAWTNELAVDSQGVFHLSYADGFARTTGSISSGIIVMWTNSMILPLILFSCPKIREEAGLQAMKTYPATNLLLPSVRLSL